MFANTPDDNDDYYEGNQKDSATPSNPFHQQRQTVAEQKAEQRNHYRPKQRAGDIVSEENTPGHFRSTRQQRRKNSQPGNKPCEQNCLIAVTLKIVFDVGKAFGGQEDEFSEAKQSSAAIMMPDCKTNVIANDCAGGGDQHDERDVKMSG